MIALIGPTPQRTVRNGDDSVARNITDNVNNGLTVEPRNDRNPGHISFLYTNARSLMPKRDELLAYIATEEPDVIAITETWANS